MSDLLVLVAKATAVGAGLTLGVFLAVEAVAGVAWQWYRLRQWWKQRSR